MLPKENGIHYVHVKLNEAHIPGSPFPMLVGKLGSDPALVMANGDGLAKGESGRDLGSVIVYDVYITTFYITTVFTQYNIINNEYSIQ